jgi:hypothetical protein
MCWKWRFTPSPVSVNSCINFPVHNIRLTAKTSAPFERTLNFGLETSWTFLLLKGMGIHMYKPICISTYMHACRPYVQRNRNIYTYFEVNKTLSPEAHHKVQVDYTRMYMHTLYCFLSERTECRKTI